MAKLRRWCPSAGAGGWARRRARLHLRLLAALGLCLGPGAAAALPTYYTDSASFLAALPGAASVEDFEGLAAGALLPSGSAVGDLTLGYSIAGLTALVTDAFDTTSGANSLGLTGGDDAFLDGDALDLVFAAPVYALGMFFVASDPAEAGEIQLETPVGTALGSGVAEAVLGDGGIVYFVGLVSTEPFASAGIRFADDGESNFAWNLDDVTTAVPEPATAALLCAGLAALGARRRGNAPATEEKSQ